jgi:EmrB/QacA subfamily drug resistance transporter
MRLDYKWQAAIVTAIGLFMAILDNTIVNVALPQMRESFHTDQNTIIWVVTGYFLAQAAVIPVTGYVSDLVGTKVVFMTALAVFTLGSLLCGLTPQIQPHVSALHGEQLLILFRVIQGFGGGALFPVAFAIIFRVFPPEQRGPASAVIGVPVLLAPAFGPTIGGYLTTTFDWTAIFFVNIPIGIAALIACAFILKGRDVERAEYNVDVPTGRRFDILGLLLSMAGFTALVYGISESGSKGLSDQRVLTFLGLGVVLLIGFVINELLVSDPVIDVRLFLNRTFTMSNILMWGVSAFLFGSFVLLPVFFENVQGRTPLNTGEILILQGLAAAVATVIAGRLYNTVGPRTMAVLGFALIAVGTYGFTNLSVSSDPASLQPWLILRGFGLGFTNIPLQTLAVSVITNRAMARASSLINVTRQVFGAIGVAALTSYLTQQTTAHASDIAATLKTQPPTGIGLTCAQNAHGNLAAVGQCVAQHALTMGINDAFFVVMIGCAALAVVAIFVGTDPNIEAAKRAKARGEEAPKAASPQFAGE